MRDQLKQYVNLLFAAAPDSLEVRDEILQNTLDRYDDLIAQGKQPEAAYRLAISGIGDINEILGSSAAEQPHVQDYRSAAQEDADSVQSRKTRAVAIAMYILSPVPLFILSEFGLATMGLCLTLGLIAAATYTIMLSKKSVHDDSESHDSAIKVQLPPKKRHIADIIRMVSLIVFLLLSFLTGAWYITWLVFLIAGCIRGLVFAIIDLKEADPYEN